ncbi:MAG: 4Fe-4S dicluster domain-containing protein [Halobacteriota archaeon]
MVTYKFLNVIEKCIDCGSCFTICKETNKVPQGIARVKVVTVNEGKPGERSIPISCMHCTNPPCEAACPTKAIHKREEDGIVMVDKHKCIGCGYCGWACPFGAPQYPHGLHGDLKEWEGIMDKCTLCVQPFVPLEKEREPSPRCALFCSTKCRLGGDIAAILPVYREKKAIYTARWQESPVVTGG